jgi:hypothetical protein
MNAVGRKPPAGFAASLTRAVRIATAIAVIAACGIAPVPDTLDHPVLGQRPSYGPALVSAEPNSAAIDRLVWMPGLDDGWDPQGLTLVAGNLFVSAYRSLGAWQFRGPCRVFRVDPETGAEIGHFDIPPPCGHAGGLAHAAGRLFVTDTHTLFETDLDRAMGEPEPKLRIFPLGRGVKGAFAISGDGAIWIGDYEEDRPAKAFKFPLSAIASIADGTALTAAAASAIVPLPTYGQGGAATASGELWISRSDIGWGVLERLDAATGRLEARYAAPPGIEGIAFDANGRLWCVSEAGARHLPWHYPFFPLIFRLDLARLAPAN